MPEVNGVTKSRPRSLVMASGTQAPLNQEGVLDLVVATRNLGKVAEIGRIIDSEALGLRLRSVAEFEFDDIEETGDSFEANAILKAETVARLTGLPALADDSGLAVNALGGAPGIYSARWSGHISQDRREIDQANVVKLLADLAQLSEEKLAAKFVAVLALAKPDGSVITVRGELEGRICKVPRGNGGFGYDPIFIPAGGDQTLAELSPLAKDSISHRGRALTLLAPKMRSFLGAR